MFGQNPRPMQPGLNLGLDPRLPISSHAADIAAALAAHPVIIVCGATGSGKSTQLPKICLAAGRGSARHDRPYPAAAHRGARPRQPHRHASWAPGSGAAVGCQVRFDDRTGPHCRVKLMTDGILLRQLTFDPELSAYDTLIIDEAHERSLNIDLLLGSLQRLCARRPDLRVIVTSATIDTAAPARVLRRRPGDRCRGQQLSGGSALPAAGGAG